MSELNSMGCAEFADSAAELALGVLTGRERAEALAHLDHCEACREHVRQLTITGEQMLGLLPAAEPPAGFETRVMERLGMGAPAPQPAPQRRRPAREHSFSPRRLLAAAAVLVAVVGAALGGWGLHASTAPAASSSLTSATLVAAGDQDHVGKVYVYNDDGQSRWMYMSVDLESGNDTVICQLIGADGHVTTVGSFRLADGYGSWGSPAFTGDGAPVGARLVSANGKVLASGTFSAAT